MKGVKFVNVGGRCGQQVSYPRQRKYLKQTIIAGLPYFLLSARRVKNFYGFFRLNRDEKGNGLQDVGFLNPEFIDVPKASNNMP